MRRIVALVSMCAVVLFGIVALGAQPRVIAQEATPTGDEVIQEGVSFDPVTFALGVDLPSPADVFVVRLGLEPGAGFPIEASDPSTGILVVESGTFSITVEGAMTVTRGATLMDAMAEAETTGDMSGASEAVPEGETVTLEAGDAAYIPSNVNGEMRNDGSERAVGLAFLAGPSDAMMGEATPVP